MRLYGAHRVGVYATLEHLAILTVYVGIALGCTLLICVMRTSEVQISQLELDSKQLALISLTSAIIGLILPCTSLKDFGSWIFMGFAEICMFASFYISPLMDPDRAIKMAASLASRIWKLQRTDVIQRELSLLYPGGVKVPSCPMSLESVYQPRQDWTTYSGLVDWWRDKQFRHSRIVLVHGDPGTGKTKNLAEFERYLLGNFDKDAVLLPIMIDLSSWKIGRESVERWIARFLRFRFGCSRGYTKEWIRQSRIVLLLDSFEDVPPKRKEAAANQLSRFVAEHPDLVVVITCRSEARKGLSALKFDSVCVLQKLESEEAMQRLLSDNGAKVASLEKLDHSIKDLATTPLMLSVMVIAYSPGIPSEGGAIDAPFDADSFPFNVQAARTHLCQQYISRILRAKQEKMPKEKLEPWLGVLARRMRENYLSILEQRELVDDLSSDDDICRASNFILLQSLLIGFVCLEPWNFPFGTYFFLVALISMCAPCAGMLRETSPREENDQRLEWKRLISWRPKGGSGIAGGIVAVGILLWIAVFLLTLIYAVLGGLYVIVDKLVHLNKLNLTAFQDWSMFAAVIAPTCIHFLTGLLSILFVTNAVVACSIVEDKSKSFLSRSLTWVSWAVGVVCVAFFGGNLLANWLRMAVNAMSFTLMLQNWTSKCILAAIVILLLSSLVPIIRRFWCRQLLESAGVLPKDAQKSFEAARYYSLMQEDESRLRFTHDLFLDYFANKEISRFCSEQILKEPVNDRWYRKRASCFSSLGLFDQAFADFEKALEISKNSQTYAERAESSYLRGDFEASYQDYVQAILLEPSWPVLHFKKALALFSLQRYEDAIDALNKAIEIQPMRKREHEIIADLSLHGFERVSLREALIPSFYKLRGDCYHLLCRNDNAIADYHECADQDPTDSEVRMRLLEWTR